MGGVGEIGIRPVGIDEHQLVITLHREKPGFSQELETIHDARPTVNEVAYTDESVFGSVEAKLVQSAVEIDSFEVNVANNEVTSNIILWKSQNSLIHAGSTLKQCVTQQVTEPVLSDFRRPVPIKKERWEAWKCLSGLLTSKLPVLHRIAIPSRLRWCQPTRSISR
jgi:hypothetical protein